jgi:putative sigma-54 modulation protein
MNVSYNGIKQALPPKIKAKLDAKFAKLSRLLEKRGEREAHVIVRQERHLQHAEITLQFYDHKLVGVASDPDLFTALSAALAKLESQAVKQRDKWREKHRREAPPVRSFTGDGATRSRAAKNPEQAAAGGNSTPRVFRVTPERRKPITLDEALLLMEGGRDYLAYRDARKESLSVLVRRRDGHFDLIES